MRFSREKVAAVVVAAMTGLLAACGGGDQVNQFRAARVLAFGDESSVLEAGGVKHGVNFVSAATDTPPLTLNCTLTPLWVQTVAAHYGLTFPQCPGGASATPSRILAVAGTGVAGVGAQIDAFVASDAFAGNELATVYSGTNDLFALQQQVAAGTLNDAQAVAAAEALGVQLADHVNRLAALGARVLVATVPDLSFTPEGRATAAGGALLSTMSVRFNARMRTALVNDGRKIGLVLFDERVRALVLSSTVNFTDPVCDDARLADVRTCTTNTLRTINGAVANLSTGLWADRRHLAPLLQGDLGSLSVTRAANNPF